jgi:hypothetical protein
VLSIFAALLGLDLLVVNTSIIFRSDPRPLSVLRSNVLTLSGYVSLPLVFAPSWIWFHAFQGSPLCRSIDATWQSVRTLTTAGPDVGLAPAAKALASVETFVGIYFLGIVIAGYVSWLKGGAR